MTAYYNEFDPGAAAWLRELIRRGLIADGVVDERSILDVEPDDLRGFTQCHFFAGICGWSYALRLAGWPDDRPVWTGSPPCQPFSAAGKQLGRNDERHLAPHWTDLVAACRPPVIFGEQVASAAVFGKSAKRTGSSTDGALEWAWLDDLFDRLEAARYACGASDIPAACVGAPHIRQRCFFGAVRLADAESAGGWPHSGSIRSSAAERIRAAERGDKWRPIERTGDACNLSSTGGLADAHVCGQPGPGIMGRPGDPAAGADREVNRTVDAGRRGGLADTMHTGRPERWSGAGNGSAAGSDIACGLADAECEQREECLSRPGQGDCSQGSGAAVELAGFCGASWPRQIDSPWGVADWLYCRDGKWRPVEPRTFPLAHGIPARVGRLRGYGNAIVPQAAAEFIRAFREVTL